MANKNPNSKGLVPVTQLDEETQFKRRSNGGVKSGITRRKNKAAKITLNDVMGQFLTEQFPLEDKDGLVERIDGKELILRLMRQELAKGGDTAVKLLRVMNDIMQGQPKVMQQINISAHEHNYLDADRMKLFDEIMGNKPADSSGADSNVVDVEYDDAPVAVRIFICESESMFYHEFGHAEASDTYRKTHQRDEAVGFVL